MVQHSDSSLQQQKEHENLSISSTNIISHMHKICKNQMHFGRRLSGYIKLSPTAPRWVALPNDAVSSGLVFIIS